ncbi:MAG: hypothetical protein ACR2G3_12635 [Solirubrobacterales bacterium]
MIKRGRITLAAFGHDLLPARETRALLTRSLRAICLVELSLDRGAEGMELVVAPLAELPQDDEKTLVAWAAITGFRRVWLPRRMIELDEPTATATATVKCPTCGLRWREEGPDFWAEVRRQAEFPGRCPVCGGTLRQWRVSGGHIAPPNGSLWLDADSGSDGS